MRVQRCWPRLKAEEQRRAHCAWRSAAKTSWQQDYGAAGGVGRRCTWRLPYTIVGVPPPGFRGRRAAPRSDPDLAWIRIRTRSGRKASTWWRGCARRVARGRKEEGGRLGAWWTAANRSREIDNQNWGGADKRSTSCGWTVVRRSGWCARSGGAGALIACANVAQPRSCVPRGAAEIAVRRGGRGGGRIVPAAHREARCGRVGGAAGLQWHGGGAAC